jgi:hypothetical protein
MSKFQARGIELRSEAKSLVLDFMLASDACQPGCEGLRLATIYRACGFDWGAYPKATSTNQQYWVVALMRELEAEGRVERVVESGPWRLI